MMYTTEATLGGNMTFKTEESISSKPKIIHHESSIDLLHYALTQAAKEFTHPASYCESVLNEICILTGCEYRLTAEVVRQKVINND